ncbi:MAG: AAA family ATPase [Pseudomonadota bacterium]|nr:AAA family ATPase [Pseudomonadota bacterium]
MSRPVPHAGAAGGGRAPRRALVVGKLSPLHLGHQLVLDTALAECDEVRVLSWSLPELPGCEAPRRRHWLDALYGVRLAGVAVLDPARPDPAVPPLPANDAPEEEPRAFVAALLRAWGWPVDVVYTSESYGDGFAAALTRALGHPVTHRRVDLGRVAIPVSGTALRADPHGLRHFLAPVVYADFVTTVAFVGAESTGKTTLAERLAAELDTTCVPEYGRTLWEAQGGLAEADFVDIGRTHVAWTEARRREARRWLFVDTTPLTTAVFAAMWHGRVDPALAALARETRYDHLFLCEPDFGFVQDGTRSDPGFQQRMQAHYRVVLAVLGVPYTVLAGPLEDRLRVVRETIGAGARGEGAPPVAPLSERS